MASLPADFGPFEYQPSARVQDNESDTAPLERVPGGVFDGDPPAVDTPPMDAHSLDESGRTHPVLRLVTLIGVTAVLVTVVLGVCLVAVIEVLRALPA